MTAVSPAAIDAFRKAEQQAWTAAAPIESQGRVTEVARDATRAGLEAAAPLLTAEALGRVHATVMRELGVAVHWRDRITDDAAPTWVQESKARIDALDWVLQRLDEEMGR